MVKLTNLTALLLSSALLMVTSVSAAAVGEALKENTGEFHENHSSGRKLQTVPAPSMAPSSPCTQEKRDRFLLKETKEGDAITRTCGWLIRKKKLQKIVCKSDESNDEFGSAKEVCPVTCGLCPKPTPPPTVCEEDEDTEFRVYPKGGRTETCGWLKERKFPKIKSICKKTKMRGEIPPAWKACPVTCMICKPPTVSPSPTMSPSVSKAPIVCTENGDDEFGFYGKIREVKMTCADLALKPEKPRTNICKAKKPLEGFDLPSEVCLVTCKICEV